MKKSPTGTQTTTARRRWIRLSVMVAVVLTGMVAGVALNDALSPSQQQGSAGIGDALRIHRSGPMPPSWAAASRTDNRCWAVKSAERGFTRKLNGAREAAGRRRLRLDPELSKAARKHTKEMIVEALLHHTTSDDLRRRVTFWSSLGENVGVGATVDSLHSAFMNSPPHRENIMHGGFRYVGVGTASGLGRMWVTVIFEESENPGTTLRMPRC